MELYVNEAFVDVSLAEGDTVDTLLRVLEKELDQRIIASMVLDGVYCSCDDPEILSRPLASIGKVEITAATREEISIALLGDAQNILGAAAQELKSGASLHRKEISNGLAWILESLDALRESLPFPPADIAILHGAVADTIRLLGQDLSPQESAALAAALENFSAPFENLKAKLASPENHSRESIHARLAAIKETLPDLAGHFQTGRDMEALSLLGGVLDAMEMYMRYAAQAPSEETRRFAEELNGLSSSLLEAFENKDYVLIADLIEFDLNDAIDAILNAMEDG